MPPVFPRHACRGLIEASRTAVRPRSCCSGFRGMRAAASLKLRLVGLSIALIANVSAACVPRPH